MATHYIAQLLLPFALMAVVHCQTSYPRFEFGDTVLTNNSYINRGGIGEGVDDSLKCVTDYSDCCAGSGVGFGMMGNADVGNWSDRDGNEVHQGVDGATSLYITRGEGVVYLNRIKGGAIGMWRCEIPHSGMMQSIYIYLGTSTTG